MLRKASLLLAVGVIALVFAGCAGRMPAGPAVAAAASAPAAPAVNTIVAEAKVLPLRTADLSLPSGGPVTEVLVREGDTAAAGQPIIRVDARRQAANVAQAEGTLARAQAQLAALQAGARPEEVATAQATLDAANAQLARLEQGAAPDDIAAAAAAVATAKGQLDKVREGAGAQQLTAAAADLANADAAVRTAQAAYDKVKGAADIGSRPESLALEQATNALTAAKARYQDVARGATQADLTTAQGRLQQAQAQLNALKAPARPAEIDAAKAEVRRAEAQLKLVQAGARPENIDAAKADVEIAQAALDQAKATLADTELKAPYDGVVAEVTVRVGEQLAAGATAVRFADLGGWKIETTDLADRQVVAVRKGARATVTVDAIPGLEIPGTVTAISQVGESRQGDIVYKVTVKPDTQDERLRWNMVAAVTIEGK
jgi:HlyD family secretion protein